MTVGNSMNSAFSEALKLFVGHGKRVTVADLAGAAGVSERNLYAYRKNETPPGWQNAMEILRVMPEAFCAMALRDAGIVGVTKGEESEACPFRLNAAATAFVAELGEFLSDGKVDHIEAVKLEQSLPQLRAAIDAFLTARAEKRRA